MTFTTLTVREIFGGKVLQFDSSEKNEHEASFSQDINLFSKLFNDGHQNDLSVIADSAEVEVFL
eukprot:CAMPEP_0202964638 /NCGR_PEP_ID=MMETSP1396-20130829/8718_1 /ASSEMBLY_ACC=CAM_ASM_000872 /TAXON_ID= /ORGANISM="Pseudokeronopsis sp., Strain Brazil" /LENGTH=63 /DNA_ID=CAMNT_0049686877 /DNA_START=269 /DNA_END=457 /DNA_ORIENTATION=+